MRYDKEVPMNGFYFVTHGGEPDKDPVLVRAAAVVVVGGGGGVVVVVVLVHGEGR